MAKATRQSEIRRVRPEEAMRRMERGETVVFIDSRNPQAWGQSNEKLPGAIRIPADEVGLHLNVVPKGNWIVTYCT